MKLTEYKSAIKMWAATAALTVSVAATAHGQSTYRIGEDTATADSGPVRMARFSLVSGHVDWRPETATSWSSASTNLPMRQGAQIWAPEDSRGEVQFDDGSDLRLGGGAVATLATLYSDSKGEFTEIKLNNGLATLHLKSKYSLYQIDTPTASIKAYGPALIRVGDTSGLEVAARAGQCVVQGQAGQVTLDPGQYLNLPVATASYAVHPIPHEDNWDKFNDQRDEVMYHESPYLPANLNLVAGNVDSYGAWHDDPQIGQVWYPRHEDPNWRPYRDGHWVWVSPFGYTWVGDEPWGWAPYHYGTWRHDHYGWGWCPGPATQYWSPAVVQFSYYNGNVAWCPLAYGEVQYPGALSVGFTSGNWALSFSIGSAGCYYPGPSGAFCVGVPWGNAYCNINVGFYSGGGINNFYARGGYDHYWGNNRFFPSNARYGGGTFARAPQFAGGGGYRGLDPRQANVFRTGRSFVGAPNGRPFSGPLSVRPTAASFTPSRSFGNRAPAAAVMNRSVFRSPVPNGIARQSSGMGKWVNPGPRSFNNAAVRGGAATTHGMAPRINRGATPGVNRGSFNRAPANRAPAGAAQNRYNRFNSVSKSQFTRSSAANRGTASTTRAQRIGNTNRVGTANRVGTSNRTTETRSNARTATQASRTNRSVSTRTRAAGNRPANRTSSVTRSTNRASSVTRTRSQRQATRPARSVNRTQSFRPSNRSTQRSNRPSRSVNRSPRPSNNGGGGRSLGGGNRGGGRPSGGGGGHRGGGGGGGGHKHGH